MTRDEIISKVISLASRRELHWKDDQKLRHFAERLQNVPDDVVFESLISFFQSDPYANGGYDVQDIAGTLLVFRRPNPTCELTTILTASAANWDVSIEQLPWFLSLNYGRENFRNAVAELLKDEGLPRKERRGLDTFLYWTAGSEEWILKQLEFEDLT